MDRTLEFQQATSRVSGEELIESLKAAREGDAAGQLQVAATMTWAAFSCPDAISAVYDNISTVWLGNGALREIDDGLPEAPLEAGFWEEYWDVVDDSRQGVIPSRANARISALGILEAHPGFMSIAERATQNHPRIQAEWSRAAASGLDPAVLRACPEGSLGRTLHDMIAGHGYNLEFIDRRMGQLSSLPQSLQRVNNRFLQMHRPWELVAGYDTGDAHQIAYGGFQLAQFGVHQAAMVLASFATIGCFLAPTGFYILLYLIAEGWRHGQETPDFMDIDWDSEWVHSVDTIRKRHRISPFRSVFSKNLFEVFGTPGT
ncbi:MAG: Coq4 family protein [Gammaproteobacteria bacterium]|nr:Coq4 family protein [Gammaproteobacteria bacterium]